MKRPITMICIMAFAMNMSAQSCVSKEELLSGYTKQYVLNEKKPDMSSYDKLVYSPGIYANHEYGDYHVYLSQNIRLRQAGRVLLPPSAYYLQEDKDDGLKEDGAGHVNLYWLGILDSLSCQENKILKNKLRKKYGSVMLNDSIEAVPVKWYDGTLFMSCDPDWHGGFIIDRPQRVLAVQNGRLLSDDRRYGLSSLMMDYYGITRVRQDIFQVNGTSRTDEALKIYAMNLLARDLTREVRKMGVKNHAYTNSYPMLITIEESGKAHMEPVYPDSLSERDKELIAPLVEAMEQQPAGILAERWVVDGRRFGAYFVKATYNEKNISWILEEYPRLHYRTGEKVDHWNKGRKGYDMR